jgi:5-methylcytosine-specific restriction endonuclease McrA
VKRGGPLRRRTPLRNKTPLKRSGNLTRSTPLRVVPDYDPEWEKARQLALARDGGCVARGWKQLCWGVPHVHHIKRRSQGGTHDLDNLATLCSGHHLYVHEHIAEARERGLLT